MTLPAGQNTDIIRNSNGIICTEIWQNKSHKNRNKWPFPEGKNRIIMSFFASGIPVFMFNFDMIIACIFYFWQPSRGQKDRARVSHKLTWVSRKIVIFTECSYLFIKNLQLLRYAIKEVSIEWLKRFGKVWHVKQ